jgi:malate dehydrogenase
VPRAVGRMKVAIVGGGGGVGASTAFNLLLLPAGYEVVLVDCREEMATSHVLDLEQVLESGGSGSIRSGDLGDALDADVLVLTAAAPLTVNTSRLDHLVTNAEIVSGLVENLHGAEREAWPGIVIVVTNPVDPLCTLVQQLTGVERGRVLGYTLNDSLRLRTGIAKALGVDAGLVDAWVLGEHGDECVPLFDRIQVGGEPVTLASGERAGAEEFLRTWYVRHVALDSGRSSTWTSGLGVARTVHAIATDARELWPASVVLRGEYGVDGVALSVPVSLGRAGAQIHEWELSAEERAAFGRAAAGVRRALERIEVELPAIVPKPRDAVAR